jgi:hypothetical protein
MPRSRLHTCRTKERRVRLLQESHENVAQNVFHAHTPCFGSHFFEHLDQAGSSKVDAIFADVPERVIAVRLAGISGIEVDDIVSTGVGDTSINSVDQIAMRVNESETFAALKILECHRFNERRFSCPCFSDHIELGKTVFVLGPEDPFVPAKINAGKERCRSAVHRQVIVPKD